MFHLLPDKQKKSLHREYLFRFLFVFSALLAAALAIAVILLFPSYLLSSIKLTEVQGKHDALLKKLSVEKGKNASAILKATKTDIGVLLPMLNEKAVATLIENLAASKPSGIAFDQFTFSHDDSAGDMLNIGGTAKTRQNLIDFQNVLKATDLFVSVDVPISDFAKDKNIEFSLDLALKKTS